MSSLHLILEIRRCGLLSERFSDGEKNRYWFSNRFEGYTWKNPKMRKGVAKEICSLERCVRRGMHMNLWPPAWTLYLAARKKNPCEFVSSGTGKLEAHSHTCTHANGNPVQHPRVSLPMKVDEMVRTSQ